MVETGLLGSVPASRTISGIARRPRNSATTARPEYGAGLPDRFADVEVTGLPNDFAIAHAHGEAGTRIAAVRGPCADRELLPARPRTGATTVSGPGQ